MEIFLPILILVIGILIIKLLPKERSKNTNLNNGERIFSDAWKRIGNLNIKESRKLNSKNRKINNKYPGNNDLDFLSDQILRTIKSRKSYYRDIYLKSDAWQRKRYVVLRRDNWTCVHCGQPATQVHHRKYAKRNIGKEPIEWLESVCKKCHDKLHF